MVYLDVPECLELRGCFSLLGIGWGHGLFPTFPTPGSEWWFPIGFHVFQGFFPPIGEDFAKNSDVRFSASMLEAPETFTVEEFSFEGWMVLNLSRSVWCFFSTENQIQHDSTSQKWWSQWSPKIWGDTLVRYSFPLWTNREFLARCTRLEWKLSVRLCLENSQGGIPCAKNMSYWWAL